MEAEFSVWNPTLTRVIFEKHTGVQQIQVWSKVLTPQITGESCSSQRPSRIGRFFRKPG
jgi:hypothetical protein